MEHTHIYTHTHIGGGPGLGMAAAGASVSERRAVFRLSEHLVWKRIKKALASRGRWWRRWRISGICAAARRRMSDFMQGQSPTRTLF